MTREWPSRPSEDEVRREVETLVRDRFAADEISTIRIAFTEHSDGFEVLTVQVAYKGEAPNAKRTLPIGGALRRRLLDISEPAFPMVSFASQQDVEANI